MCNRGVTAFKSCTVVLISACSSVVEHRLVEPIVIGSNPIGRSLDISTTICRNSRLFFTEFQQQKTVPISRKTVFLFLYSTIIESIGTVT